MSSDDQCATKPDRVRSSSSRLHGISNRAFTADESPVSNGYLNLSAMEKQNDLDRSIETNQSISSLQPSTGDDLQTVKVHRCCPNDLKTLPPADIIPVKCALSSTVSNCSHLSKLSVNRTKSWSVFRGLLLTFCSSIFFSLTAVIVKQVNDVHAGQMAVVRFAGMLLFSFPLALDTKEGPLLGESKSRWWLLLRGLGGATSLYLRYSALHYLPISNATIIVLSMPVFVCILGRVFLKEACGIFHVIALTVTLVGIAFTSNLTVILGSTDEQAQSQGIDRQNELYGLLCGMGAAITGSSTYIIVRKVRHLPHSTILFNFSWVALAESLFFAYTVHDGLSLPQDPVVPWLLVLLGVFSFYGQMLLTRALQAEEAALVSVTRCAAEVFFAFVFQVLFFRQMPTWFSVIGAVLVTTAVMLTSVRKWVATLPASHWAYRWFWFTLK